MTQETNNTSTKLFKDLSSEERELLLKDLRNTEKLLEIQAKIATHRKVISEAKLSELIANIKIYQLQNPPKNDPETNSNSKSESKD